ncbi:MAG: hypothetical protein GX235_05145 [Clostridiales bacterium]|nr:hypothetical protein [Clostridiales bacterium]
MLSVSLIFLYVLLTAYVAGFLVLTGIRHFCTCRSETDAPEIFWYTLKADSYCMAGLVTLTVYAQVFSLFYKVGLAANIILLIICTITAVIFRKQLYREVLGIKERLTRGKMLGCLFLFLLFAYGTSRGIIHYDTGLYHAQSIRWIEEFGTVKGLGNLHCRLAYNSSAFSLSALYSFSFLGTQSYHCMAGFFALLLAKVCGEIGTAFKRRRLILSDFARIAGIYYLLIIFDEMVSPASDYFTVLTVFYLIIRFLDLLERKEEYWVPYGLLSLVSVYAMSLKLSAALILLLVIKPAAMLIKKRNYRGFFSFIGLGIIVIIPYLLRNVIISGWLVYPFTAVDMFSVDWKIPKGIADYDAREIQVWGRGIYDVTRYAEPISLWFRDWLNGLGTLDKLSVFAAGFAVFISIAALVVIFMKKKKEMYGWLLVTATVNLSFLFWLFSAPLIRYGCVYVWLAAAVTFGGLLTFAVKNRKVWKAVYIALGFVACYKAFAFGREIVTSYDGNYFINQKDYENFETIAYEIGGITFYYPAEGDRTGYMAFPSSPVKAEVALRGADIDSGFRYNKKTIQN